jgi:hypothetical protein
MFDRRQPRNEDDVDQRLKDMANRIEGEVVPDRLHNLALELQDKLGRTSNKNSGD